MIKSNELRRGNWVNATYDGIDYKQVFGIPNMDEFAAEPISLTPEILEKVKFGGTIFPSQISISDSGKYYWGNGVNVEIKYVHQLQNLYFCLCGTELEINLNP